MIVYTYMLGTRTKGKLYTLNKAHQFGSGILTSETEVALRKQTVFFHFPFGFDICIHICTVYRRSFAILTPAASRYIHSGFIDFSCDLQGFTSTILECASLKISANKKIFKRQNRQNIRGKMRIVFRNKSVLNF